MDGHNIGNLRIILDTPHNSDSEDGAGVDTREVAPWLDVLNRFMRKMINKEASRTCAYVFVFAVVLPLFYFLTTRI